MFGLTAGSGVAHPTPVKVGKVPPLVFPVVGKVTYISDFGAARGQGAHEGNDLMAPWRAPVVAAEAGKVKFWTTSTRAGCMLYLYGQSGTTYLYIHLNNDLTAANDNRGKCVAGVAYWKGLKDGSHVQAGQPIAYNGNSGDANSRGYHTQFEVHPGGGGAVDPYPHLRKAQKLLFAMQPNTDFTAALRGSVLKADPSAASLTLMVERVQSWPGGVRVTDVKRAVVLAVPPEVVISDPLGALIASAKLAALRRGQTAVAWTEKARATLDAALGRPLTLSAARLVVSG